jgi:tetratricopeptide (TPR) repeat protein
MVDSTVSAPAKPVDQIERSQISPTTGERDSRATHRRRIKLAIIISLLALLISIFSFLYTVLHDTQTDHQNHQAALREQIKFLINLNENSNYVNAIAKEAFNLAVSFPDDATSPDMIIIGNALSHVFDSRRAEKLMLLAIDRSDDPGDEARARRAWGSILMFQKRFDEADQQFNEAMKVHLKYKSEYDETLIPTRNLWTLINWTNALIQAKRCGEAKDKIGDSQKLLPSISDEFKVYALSDIETTKSFLITAGCND